MYCDVYLLIYLESFIMCVCALFCFLSEAVMDFVIAKSAHLC